VCGKTCPTAERQPRLRIFFRDQGTTRGLERGASCDCGFTTFVPMGTLCGALRPTTDTGRGARFGNEDRRPSSESLSSRQGRAARGGQKQKDPSALPRAKGLVEPRWKRRPTSRWDSAGHERVANVQAITDGARAPGGAAGHPSAGAAAPASAPPSAGEGGDDPRRGRLGRAPMPPTRPIKNNKGRLLLLRGTGPIRCSRRRGGRGGGGRSGEEACSPMPEAEEARIFSPWVVLTRPPL